MARRVRRMVCAHASLSGTDVDEFGEGEETTPGEDKRLITETRVEGDARTTVETITGYADRSWSRVMSP
jgi:hypothetical protein